MDIANNEKLQKVEDYNMNKKNKNACIHLDLTGINAYEGDLKAHIKGAPLTLAALYAELTKKLVESGVPIEIIEAAYRTAMGEIKGDKAVEERLKEAASAFADIFK